jgi:hypothetical protein
MSPAALHRLKGAGPIRRAPGSLPHENISFQQSCNPFLNHCHQPGLCGSSPRGIRQQDRIIYNIAVEVRPGLKLDRVFRDESTHLGIIVSKPIFIQSSLRIELAGSVLEVIRQCAGLSSQIPKRIIGVGVSQGADELLRDVIDRKVSASWVIWSTSS